MQYLQFAAFFDNRALIGAAKLFFDQAAEEREHALRFLRYVLDTGGVLQIPEIEAPKSSFLLQKKLLIWLFNGKKK